jgi:hypothetical protein
VTLGLGKVLRGLGVEGGHCDTVRNTEDLDLDGIDSIDRVIDMLQDHVGVNHKSSLVPSGFRF